eukprot:CAMPEP_0179463774 /NCGR_PEP_ID=MMETSP0799-20121207/45741_1 /TAXON_ID=46947 /ORGANISM="Geminigera cryophila, Strain CCMP2564" /LENGTH=280 /DNA_ID=CAMNT_0021267195 /DNA_START=455 /DNA_END=1297 /DNA_ORIENTATION=-
MPPGDVLFSYGNNDYLPFHLHWLCNTAGWPGVHERTILAVQDERSQESIRKLSSKVHTYVVPELSRTHGFYSKGYRKLTIKRIVVLIEILASGRGVIMFEGDALWTGNILNDQQLAGTNRSHDVAFYRDGKLGEHIGAGLMSMKGNRSGAFQMWKNVLKRLNDDMKPFDAQPDSATIPVERAKHEQDILREDILPVMLKHREITMINLDRCSYTSGLWYIRKTSHMQMCGSKPPVILNNNYIVGNQNKINRAKQRKHWFLSGDGCANWEDTLNRAIQTFK